MSKEPHHEKTLSWGLPPVRWRPANSAEEISNRYTMGCLPVRGDNTRVLASGLSYVQVYKHGKTILYHLHQSIPGTSRDI